MTIHLDLTYEEAQIIRSGLAYAIQHAKDSAKAIKGNPLHTYRCKEVEKQYKGIREKISGIIAAEVKKAVDAKNNKGV